MGIELNLHNAIRSNSGYSRELLLQENDNAAIMWLSLQTLKILKT